MKFVKKVSMRKELYENIVELTKHIKECEANLKDLREQALLDMQQHHSGSDLKIGGGVFKVRTNRSFIYPKMIRMMEADIETMKKQLNVEKGRAIAAGKVREGEPTYSLVLTIDE